MSHVAAQVRSEVLSREKLKRREVALSPRGSGELQRYKSSRPRRGMKQSGANSLPNISMLAIREGETWELNTTPSPRPHSEHSTPTSTTSTIASIFEVPSIGPWETPNSSTHSLFVAELEDTSPKVVTRQVHPVDFPLMSPNHREISSHKGLAVEGINIIEENNRHLLERVVAAEDAATALRDQNAKLQQYVDYCKEEHRPKTAPSPSPSPAHPRSSRLASPTGPISTFNTQSLIRPPLPLSHRKPSPLSQPPKLSISTSPPSPLRPRMPATPPASPTHRPIHRPPPIIISHFSTNYDVPSSDPSISSPIPGTVKRHPVTFGGTPLSKRHPVSTISLAEAQMREKPLPVLTVLSPSVVHGFVEIGSRVEQSAWDTETEMESVVGGGWGWGRKKVVKGLIKWAKRK